MSHISHFDSDVRLEESAAVTKSLAKVVRGQDKAALWESCLAQLTPRQRHPSQLISRRISFQPDLQIGVEDEDHAQEIHLLCDRPWLVLRLSPLFGFSYDPDFFSRWADSIKEDFLSGGGRSQLPLNQSITVQVDKVHGLRGTTEDPEAVQIQVFAQRSRQALFTAFLLSVDCVTSVELGSHSEQITELPVMLCFGLKELEKVVRDSLGKCFNCVVSDVQIKEEDLKWITAMWSRLSSIEEEETEAERAGEASNVTLTYTFPADFKDTLRTVDVGLKQRQLGQLWRSVFDELESFATTDEVNIFHEALTNQVGKSIGLNLEELTLAKIKIPILTAEESGKIQMFSSSHAKSVLVFITELCSVGLVSDAPPIGTV